MEILIAGLVLFFGAHFYSAFRSRTAGADIKERIGEAKYMGLYSLVSLAGFALLVWGYSLAQPTQYLFTGFAGGRDVAAWLMVPALVLLVASQMPMGHIKRIVVHPMLVAVAIWAIAHLIDGANLKQLLLFGSFLLYSLIDILAVNRRNRRLATEDPGAEHGEPKFSYDLIALAVGVVAYLALIYGLHEWLFGYVPLV